MTNATHAHVEEVVIEKTVNANTDKHLVAHKGNKDLTAKHAQVS